MVIIELGASALDVWGPPIVGAILASILTAIVTLWLSGRIQLSIGRQLVDYAHEREAERNRAVARVRRQHQSRRTILIPLRDALAADKVPHWLLDHEDAAYVPGDVGRSFATVVDIEKRARAAWSRAHDATSALALDDRGASLAWATVGREPADWDGQLGGSDAVELLATEERLEVPSRRGLIHNSYPVTGDMMNALSLKALVASLAPEALADLRHAERDRLQLTAQLDAEVTRLAELVSGYLANPDDW